MFKKFRTVELECERLVLFVLGTEQELVHLVNFCLTAMVPCQSRGTLGETVGLRRRYSKLTASC